MGENQSDVLLLHLIVPPIAVISITVIAETLTTNILLRGGTINTFYPQLDLEGRLNDSIITVHFQTISLET